MTMRITRSKKLGAKRELESDTDGSQEELSQNKKVKVSPESPMQITTINPIKMCLFSTQLRTKITPKFAENNTIASILSLPHPKTGHATTFALTTDTNELCEIKIFSKTYKTILTPNRIISRPNIYFITPFDPIFILLALLETQNSDHYCLIEQLLFNTEFEDLRKIIPTFSQYVIELICDTKIHDGQIACKYSKEKTMSTLESKVQRVAERLQNLDSFQSCYKSIVSTKDGALKYAISLVNEYLTNKLSGDLAIHLGLTDYSHLIAECEQEVRKMQVASVTEVETKKGTKKQPPKKQSRAKKMLENTDKSGMKSLSTFFTKPKD